MTVSTSSPSQQAPLVWVLHGGTSTEHDVSLVSGQQVACALAGVRCRVRPVVIDQSGLWQVAARTVGPSSSPQETTDLALNTIDKQPRLDCDRGLAVLREDAPACVFIALHGPGGEDGGVQSLMEALDVPYTGSGPAASSLAMDKIRSQAFFRQMGFKIAPSVSSLDIAPDARRTPAKHIWALTDLAKERLSLPLFVKPSCGGSSLCVHRVDDVGDLAAGIADALDVANEVLIEEQIAGRELTCGVLDLIDTDGGAQTEALPVTEIRPVGRDYFDYIAKYTPNACEEITPAPVSNTATERIQAAALRAHTLLGCQGVSRADFILDDCDEPFLLEVNTIPGMTPTSLLPQQAAAVGISFEQLCVGLVDHARRLGRRRPWLSTGEHKQ